MLINILFYYHNVYEVYLSGVCYTGIVWKRVVPDRPAWRLSFLVKTAVGDFGVWVTPFLPIQGYDAKVVFGLV